MTTRQVAGLLATAAPEVVPPRDTLRAVAPDRFTLKVSIDREYEQGLRQLKDLRSHLDPRMSWGDLVARLVREAVARHDPRGGRSPAHACGQAGSIVAAGTEQDTGGRAAGRAGWGRRRVMLRRRRAKAPRPGSSRGQRCPPTPPRCAARRPLRRQPVATPAGGVAIRVRAGVTASATPAADAAPAVESRPARSAPEPASATSAAAAAPEGQSAGARETCPARRASASGAPRRDRRPPHRRMAPVRRTGLSCAPEAAAAPKSARRGAADGSDAAPGLARHCPSGAEVRQRRRSSTALISRRSRRVLLRRRSSPVGAQPKAPGAALMPPDTPPAPKFAGGGAAEGPGVAPVSPSAPPVPKFAGGDTVEGFGAALVSPCAPPAPKFAGGGAAEGPGAAPVSPSAPPCRSSPTAAQSKAPASRTGPRRAPLRCRSSPAVTQPKVLAAPHWSRRAPLRRRSSLAVAQPKALAPRRSRRAATPVPKFAGGGTVEGPGVAPVSPCAPPVPKFAGGDTAEGFGAALVLAVRRSGAEVRWQWRSRRSWRRAGSRRAPPPVPEFAGGVPPARGAGGARTGVSPQATGAAPRGLGRTPVRRPIPAAVRRHVWLRDGGRCSYRDPLTGRRCNSSHLLQIDHLLPVAEGGGPEPSNLAL